MPPSALRRLRRDYVGRPVIDRLGQDVGVVADTWPLDGGGEPELALVKLRRFARRRWIRVEDLQPLDEQLFARHSRVEIEDAPDAEDGGWGDPPSVALAHWRLKDH